MGVDLELAEALRLPYQAETRSRGAVGILRVVLPVRSRALEHDCNEERSSGSSYVGGFQCCCLLAMGSRAKTVIGMHEWSEHGVCVAACMLRDTA